MEEMLLVSRKLAERRPIIRLALSRAELALSIGVSVGSIDQMVEEGALPHPRRWHSRKLWLVSDVEAHLSEWPSDEDDSGWNDYEPPETSTAVAKPANGPGGYPMVRDRYDPLTRYYERIGFDPLTMGHEDMIRLQREAEEKWAASIPGTPLGKRELNALKQLGEHGVGVPVEASLIKNCGPDTEDRLKARGFIETRPHPKSPTSVESYVLTEAGLNAWRDTLGQ